MFLSTYHTIAPLHNQKVSSTDTSVSSTSILSDISHRGGMPGFVRIVSETELVYPEYSGNNMFMTLGNLHSNPKAGLLFLDFSHNRMFQLSGTAVLHTVDKSNYSTNINKYAMDGSTRYVLFTITEAVRLSAMVAGQFSGGSSSPFNPPLSGFRGNSISHYTSMYDNNNSVKLPPIDGSTENKNIDRDTELVEEYYSPPDEIQMHLTTVTQLTPTVAMFDFVFSTPYEVAEYRYYPGQYATVQVQLPYLETETAGTDTHSAMQSLLIGAPYDTVHRSWTVTSTTHAHNDRHILTGIQFTVKHNTNDGCISVWLHELARLAKLSAMTATAATAANDHTVSNNTIDVKSLWQTLTTQHNLSFVLKGISGTFSIYNTNYMPPAANTVTKPVKSKQKAKKVTILAPTVEACHGKLLFLSGGIGVTPFIATIHSFFDRDAYYTESIVSSGSEIRVVDILLGVTFRSLDELMCVGSLLQYVNSGAESRIGGVSVRLSLFATITTTAADNSAHTLQPNVANLLADCAAHNANIQYGSRITEAMLTQQVPDIATRDVYLCGPDAFMSSLSEVLVNHLSVSETHVHTEEFYF